MGCFVGNPKVTTTRSALSSDAGAASQSPPRRRPRRCDSREILVQIGNDEHDHNQRLWRDPYTGEIFRGAHRRGNLELVSSSAMPFFLGKAAFALETRSQYLLR
ncbi:hypothetical protein SCUP515_00890 [Seiridium cupressi]